MDYYERIQNAVEFIEAHLDDPCSMADIAATACFSPFHFQRLFQAITGFSVQTYIRQRRLSEAALQLRETTKSILELALVYQYGSQEAFTRAFERFFGITPAKYRKEAAAVPLQGRIDFLAYRQQVSGELNVNKPELVQLAKTKIVGYRYRTTLSEERYFTEIPGFHRDFGENERYLHIPQRTAPAISYGISYEFADDGSFSFLVGEQVDAFAEVLEPGFHNLELPAGMYAVFSVNGSVELIQNARRYIYGAWLPASNYERGTGPDFEVTDVLRSVFPHALRMKIYIPLEKS